MKRTERQHLSTIIAEVRAWAGTCGSIRHLATHLPLTGPAGLRAEEQELVRLVEAASATDPALAERAAKTALFDGRKSLRPAHEAASRLTSFHREMLDSGRDEVLAKVHRRYVESLEQERSRLRTMLAELEQWGATAAKTLDDVAHMPLSRAGVLEPSESTTLEAMAEIVALHRAPAISLLDDSTCSSGSCAEAHGSAALLADVYAEAVASDAAGQIRVTTSKVSSRTADEGRTLQALRSQMSRWPPRIAAVRSSRSEATSVIHRHVTTSLKSAAALDLGGASLRLLPFSAEDEAVVTGLALLRDSPVTADDEARFETAIEWSRAATKALDGVLSATGECARDGRCAYAHALMPEAAAVAGGVQEHLDRFPVHPHSGLSLDDLLDPTLRLMSYVSGDFHSPELLDSALVSRSRDGLSAIANAARTTKEAAAAAKAAADRVRSGDVATALQAMDLDVLRKASTESIRVAPLNHAGLRTVWAVLKYLEKHMLADLPGLGDASARGIAQAAIRLREGVRDETPVRIDVKARRKETTELLDSLRRWDAARRFDPTKDEVAVAKALLTLKKTPTQVLVLASGRASEVPRIADILSGALDRSPGSVTGDVWRDFLSRPADYFGMLTELGFVTEDEAKMHGDLPEEIVEAVRAKELNRDYLTASLRAYQSFGARFVLVQRKVVIGDEMGLGKTVEALATLAHLRAAGDSHFLVVCPAAVVSNWVRETSKHTRLDAFRLHGPQWERAYAATSWARKGGVAVTTYDLLPWANEHLAQVEVGCAVFDEAHYIKNPLAKRSQAAQDLIDTLPYAVLMTGTPLENRVQEFRNLIGYLRRDLADSAPEYLPSKFRKHVAPAYLRRNQEDVLTELPELVETDDWMGMSESDARDYRRAVDEGHFMLMRRAAMLSEHSMKVERLVEIVREAEDNDRRVIVFSYFRDVLSKLADLLPGDVYGPLTGSVPAVERQRLVDRFSSAKGGAVLVSQITAGGVGLNIQSASVVVICEPQLKPTMEAQAIARAHRMGQANTVQVHRLLTENSVDERVREILAEKRQLFDEFARDSVIAKSAPDAVDMSDAELARVVIAAERERLFGADLPGAD